MDSSREDSLKLLNEALSGPKGDYVITVESNNRALLHELWTLQGNGVIITEQIQKAGHDPGLVWIVLTGTASAVLAGTASAVRIVKDVLEIVRSQTNGDKKKAKTQIRTRKDVVEIAKLLLKYEKDVDAVIDVVENEEESEDNPEGE